MHHIMHWNQEFFLKISSNYSSLKSIDRRHILLVLLLAPLNAGGPTLVFFSPTKKLL